MEDLLYWTMFRTVSSVQLDRIYSDGCCNPAVRGASWGCTPLAQQQQWRVQRRKYRSTLMLCMCYERQIPVSSLAGSRAVATTKLSGIQAEVTPPKATSISMLICCSKWWGTVQTLRCVSLMLHLVYAEVRLIVPTNFTTVLCSILTYAAICLLCESRQASMIGGIEVSKP